MMIEREPVPTGVIPRAAPVVVGAAPDEEGAPDAEVEETVGRVKELLDVAAELELDIGAVRVTLLPVDEVLPEVVIAVTVVDEPVELGAAVEEVLECEVEVEEELPPPPPPLPFPS